MKSIHKRRISTNYWFYSLYGINRKLSLYLKVFLEAFGCVTSNVYLVRLLNEE